MRFSAATSAPRLPSGAMADSKLGSASWPTRLKAGGAVTSAHQGQAHRPFRGADDVHDGRVQRGERQAAAAHVDLSGVDEGVPGVEAGDRDKIADRP